MVIAVPAAPVAGATVEIVAVSMVMGTLLDAVPPCWTWTYQDWALDATVATICVSLQDTTVPLVLPSHTIPLPSVDPKPEPMLNVSPTIEPVVSVPSLTTVVTL